MAELPPIRLLICPECNAAGDLQQSRCWLCGHVFTEDRSPVEAELIPEHGAGQFSLSTLLLAVTLACVCAGAATVEPGYAVVLVMVSVSAWIGTVITKRKYAAKGKPLGWFGRIVAFVVSAIVSYMALVAVVVILVMAVFLALAIYCSIAIATPGGGFL
jgi:hypothetical protein